MEKQEQSEGFQINWDGPIKSTNVKIEDLEKLLKYIDGTDFSKCNIITIDSVSIYQVGPK